MSAPDAARVVLDGLDDEQRAAVVAPQGPVRILAGAGTGKTRSITRRIAYQHHVGAAASHQVLAVTHSKKEAAEMRERLAALGVSGCTPRTFHAAALRQLRHFWSATGRGAAGPRVISDGDALTMIRRALAGAARRGSREVDSVAVLETSAEISWAHARRVIPSEYVKAARAAGRVTSTPQGQIAAAYAGYEDAKRDAGVLDFDDLLSVCADLLENDPQVAGEIRAGYRSILVDEYQDTDLAQQRLLDSWLGDSDSICVVGDPQQAIYGFKGADPQLLVTFPKRYPRAVCVDLVRDYRSTPQIVEAANRLTAAHGVVLEGQQPPGPTPTVTAYDDEQAETAGVVTAVCRLLADDVPAGEIAVLHRFNSQAPALRAALADAGITTAVREDDRFYERPEIRDLLAALSNSVNVDGDQSAIAALDAALEAAGFDTSNPPAGAGAARERWEARAALRAMCIAMPGAAITTVERLHAELADRAAREHIPTGAAGVTVTTIHKAKGLEWDAVIMPRMTDGSLPSSLATTPAEQAEERRLCYVAVTRARRHLVLSWARTWGEQQRRSDPSPYLAVIEPAPRQRSNRSLAGRRQGSVARTAARQSVPIGLGDRVSHQKYGLGRVVAVRPGSDGPVASIDFGDGKVRNLHLNRETQLIRL